MDFYFGKEKFIESHSPGHTTYQAMQDPALEQLASDGAFHGPFYPPGVEGQAPTPQFLSQSLKSNQDIEILATRDDGRELTLGHYVTVVGLQWVDTNMDGMIDASEGAQLTIIDPSQPVTDQVQTRPLFQDSDGLLYIINPTTQKRTDIRLAVDESPITDSVGAPEPSTLILVATGFVGLTGARLRRGPTRAFGA